MIVWKSQDGPIFDIDKLLVLVEARLEICNTSNDVLFGPNAGNKKLSATSQSCSKMDLVEKLNHYLDIEEGLVMSSTLSGAIQRCFTQHIGCCFSRGQAFRGI